jgi:hypothetical protein
MYQIHNLREPPEQLVGYLQANIGKNALELRRRAVLAQTPEGKHLLICCTVEAYPAIGLRPATTTPRRYPDAILYEDWLSPEKCREFIGELQRGTASFGDARIEGKENLNWSVERVPMQNNYMTRAGHVASIHFESTPVGFSQYPLLVPGQPYYPNLVEAARHWLPFAVYHGDTDGRNQAIHFLLPEARAFFSEANISHSAWDIHIEGTEAHRLNLVVTGAYWKDNAIVHFEEKVGNGKASIPLPDDVDRLDYVLMDSNGEVYDFQREDQYNHTGLGRHRLDGAAQDLNQQIRNACLDGEGVQAEFKSFVDPAEAIGQKTKKTKLREVVTTVVAFANTQGGRLYIGIDDHCRICGIDQELQRSERAAVTEDSIERYRGALTSAIRNELHGDVRMSVSHTLIEGVAIIVVDVDQRSAIPVMVRGDNIFYVRAGASNRQLPPDQWMNVLGPLPLGHPLFSGNHRDVS